MKVKVESVMQPGFLVAAAAAAVAAYRDAGFCSPGCHGCTREVVPSNLLPSLLTVVISAAWCATVCSVQRLQDWHKHFYNIVSFVWCGVCISDHWRKS